MTEEEWNKQFQTHKANVAKGVNDLMGQARLGINNLNRNNLDKTSKELLMEMMSMATAARNLAAYNEENAPMLDGAKAVADSLAALMGLLGTAMDNPDELGTGLQDALIAAEKMFQNAELLMTIKLTDAEVDKGASLFMAEIIRQVDLNLDDLVMKVKKGADRLPEDKKKELQAAANKLTVIKGIAVQQLKALSPVMQHPDANKQLNSVHNSLDTIAKSMTARANQFNIPNAIDLTDAAFRLNKALEALLMASQLAEKQGATGDIDLTTPVQQLVNDLARVRTNIDDPKGVIEAVKASAADQNDIITATSAIASAAESLGDRDTKERLTRAAAALTNSIKGLMEATRAYAKSPNDPELVANMLAVVGDLEKQAMVLIGDAGTQSALNNLRYAAKVTSASLIKLNNSASSSSPDISDAEAQKQLKKDVKASDENLSEFLKKLKAATNDPRSFPKQNELLETALFQLPGYSELVADAKRATASINDPTRRQDLDLAATEVSNNLRLLAKAVANVSSLSGDSNHEAALGELDVVRADLEAAEYLAAQGKLVFPSNATKESASAMFGIAAQQLTDSIAQIRNEAQKGYSSGLGGSIREASTALAQIATAMRPLAAAVSADRNVQRDVIAAAIKALDATVDAISIHRALAIDKDSSGKKSAADRSYKQFDRSVIALKDATRGTAPADISEASRAIEEARERLAKGLAPKDAYKVDEARAATKALALSVDQLQASARAQPDALGYSSKVVAAAGVTAIDAATSQVKANMSDTKRAAAIKVAADDVAAKTLLVLAASKDLATSAEPSSALLAKVRS